MSEETRCLKPLSLFESAFQELEREITSRLESIEKSTDSLREDTLKELHALKHELEEVKRKVELLVELVRKIDSILDKV